MAVRHPRWLTVSASRLTSRVRPLSEDMAGLPTEACARVSQAMALVSVSQRLLDAQKRNIERGSRLFGPTELAGYLGGDVRHRTTVGVDLQDTVWGGVHRGLSAVVLSQVQPRRRPALWLVRSCPPEKV